MSRNDVLKIAGVVFGIVGVIGTVIIVVLYFPKEKFALDDYPKSTPALAFGLWTIVPPLWFLIQWAAFKEDADNKLEHFKYSQELAKNMWIAIGVVLGVLYGISAK